MTARLIVEKPDMTRTFENFGAKIIESQGEPILEFGFFSTIDVKETNYNGRKTEYFPLVQIVRGRADNKYHINYSNCNNEFKRSVQNYQTKLNKLQDDKNKKEFNTTVLTNLVTGAREYFGVSSNGKQNSPAKHGAFQKAILPYLDCFFENAFFSEHYPFVEKHIAYTASDRGGYYFSDKESKYVGAVIQKFLSLVSSNNLVERDKLAREFFSEKRKNLEKKEEKEETMANALKPQTVTTGLLDPTPTMAALSDAVKQGAQVAVADEAANAILAIAEVMVGDAYPELAKTENGKLVAKLVASTLLHHAAASGIPFIPDTEATKFACELVMQAAARDLIQPRIALLTPALTQLAAVGKNALAAKA